MGLFSKKDSGGSDFLSMMGNARKEAKSNLETNMESFEGSLKEAVKTFGEFSTAKNSAKLKKAAQDFLKLIRQKPSRVEPYVYLAYILYLFDKTEEAKKYLKFSEMIDPDYQYIKPVRALLFSR
jgi:tetratricopeptide (TPR) repeat protein